MGHCERVRLGGESVTFAPFTRVVGWRMHCGGVLAVLSLLSVWAATPARAQREQSVAYESQRDLKAISPDGTGRTALKRTPAGFVSVGPAWSSSGSLLAFARAPLFEGGSRRKAAHLMVRDATTGSQRAVAADAFAGAPSFAPDESSVAYVAQLTPDGASTAIRAVSLIGQGVHDVTHPRAKERDQDPAWSPDGARIAYTHVRFSRALELEIWSTSPDGSAATRLAKNAYDPAWSPDGRRIAFISLRDHNGATCFSDCFTNGEIYVMNSDGSGKRRLTRTTTDEAAPAWSPDGAQIAFHSARPIPEGNAELYTMRADGSCTTRLTNTSVSNTTPAWRPGSAYAAPLVCDGAVPGARSPAMETDLSPARRFHRHRLAWLGPSYRGVLLSAVDIANFVTFIYDDCGRVSRRCGFSELQVQTTSICRRDPLTYGGYQGPGESDGAPHAKRYRRVGSALLADYGGGEIDIHTGRITVTIFGAHTLRSALAVAHRVRVLGTKTTALEAPTFSRRTARRARVVKAGLRRYGLDRLSERWHVSRDQIAAAVKLRKVLTPHELRRGAGCAHLER